MARPALLASLYQVFLVVALLPLFLIQKQQVYQIIHLLTLLIEQPAMRLLASERQAEEEQAVPLELYPGKPGVLLYVGLRAVCHAVVLLLQ